MFETKAGRQARMALVLCAATGGTVLIATQGHGQSSPLPFEDAEIRIETNATDGDAGIQAFFDGGPFRFTRITAPNGVILDLTNRNALAEFGLTEVFFESNEPNFDDVPLAETLLRFPEGTYVFAGRTVDGGRLRSVGILTHDLPAAPVILTPEEDEEVAIDEVVVSFEPVTTSLDVPGAPVRPIAITSYEVIVESETEPSRSLDLFLDPDVTSIAIPVEFLEPGTDYSLEVLAIEESGNQTITETSFSVE